MSNFRVVLEYDKTAVKILPRFSITVVVQAEDAAAAIALAVEAGRASVDAPTFNWCERLVEWLDQPRVDSEVDG